MDASSPGRYEVEGVVSMLLPLVLLLPACGLPECATLCEERAACVSATIEAYGSTWSDWTGFADRSAYEDACYAEFQASYDGGAPADDLQDRCREEQGTTCPGG